MCIAHLASYHDDHYYSRGQRLWTLHLYCKQATFLERWTWICMIYHGFIISYDILKVNCIPGCVLLLERKASQNPKITCTVALNVCVCMCVGAWVSGNWWGTQVCERELERERKRVLMFYSQMNHCFETVIHLTITWLLEKTLTQCVLFENIVKITRLCKTSDWSVAAFGRWW